MKKSPTLNKNGQPRRAGSGRQKGSFSFINVTLQELINKFNDGSQTIPISRKFAELINITGECKSAKALTNKIEGTSIDPLPAVKIVDLNQD
jgi:hypothetical protein